MGPFKFFFTLITSLYELIMNMENITGTFELIDCMKTMKTPSLFVFMF